MSSIDDLVGETLTSVRSTDDHVYFDSADRSWAMYHSSDCCESVTIESIAGDLDDLVGSPILFAYAACRARGEPKNVEFEVLRDPSLSEAKMVEAMLLDSGGADTENHDESYTWTFYRIGTNKGTVVIRWYGTSNGYYSESVEFSMSRNV